MGSFFCEAQLDPGHAVGDLAGHELLAAARALVVEEDAGDGEQAVALAVVDGDVVAVGLGHAVGAARVEGRDLGLRHLADLAEHLAAGGLVELRLGADGRMASSRRVTPRAVNSPVSTGWLHEVGTKDMAARL